MNGLDRRMDRLQYPAGASATDGIAERVQAARLRGQESPKSQQENAARWAALLADYDADVAAGIWIDPLRARLANGLRRTGWGA